MIHCLIASDLLLTDPETIPSVSTGDIGATFIKMLLTFTALIFLLFGTYWFIRRLIRFRLEKGTGSQSIQIVEKKMLSPKTMLYLVELEGKKILIAESQLEIKGLVNFSEIPTESTEKDNL